MAASTNILGLLGLPNIVLPFISEYDFGTKVVWFLLRARTRQAATFFRPVGNGAGVGDDPLPFSVSTPGEMNSTRRYLK